MVSCKIAEIKMKKKFGVTTIQHHCEGRRQRPILKERILVISPSIAGQKDLVCSESFLLISALSLSCSSSSSVRNFSGGGVDVFNEIFSTLCDRVTRDR